MLNVSVQQEKDPVSGSTFNTTGANVRCDSARTREGGYSVRTTGLSNSKKSSVTTKIILKEAAKPHHNLGERVAQVRRKCNVSCVEGETIGVCGWPSFARHFCTLG